ncbi:efflux RND transporter permease subunit [Bdellovibrio reynosensis]|uniref:Efflux RND transporter permease subunit n=1 Tax=Bdellovibrio reynosensis TaxID=2835041 RepID=A0ABY4CBT6_9BACT|nr:efflux RND transporter permease subunit [Bdellovibrio reynosensis]UOF01904.1 efflux RND transporter permease subunit [Bdellovibrio reynosensis]
MLNSIIRFALNHRLLVISFSALLIVYGAITLKSLPIDVFPDLTKPTITIMTEGHGRAPEEVETLITLPLENSLNGIPGLERVRSTSGIGLSVIYLEFGWKADLYRSRQLVAEKLQLAREYLPKDTQPVMAPIASLMGQIQQIAISTTNESISPIELRTLAEWTVRPRLMAIPGVAQVISIGGGLKQYQISISAEKLNQYQITLEQLDTSLEKISQNTTGGFLDKDRQELLVRNIGAVSSIEDIQQTVVGLHFGRPILVKDIAQVQEGARTKRGDGSYLGKPAVIMVVQKQPGADTVSVTRSVDQAIAEMKSGFPKDVLINTNVFKQSHFIENAISGIIGKLKFGTVLVFIVLLVFLANLRMSLITLTAIPLSFFITFIVFKIMGLSVNTMTLGGLAIAIGELVDDSIVDVENIYRRFRENKLLKNPKSVLKVVFEASSEVRNSIVLATVIIALVFLPLLNLTGLEGRLFTPLAISYLTALLASLLVSLTITPVLSSYLLKTRDANKEAQHDTKLVAKLKAWDEKALKAVLDHPKKVLGGTALAFLISLSLVPFMGKDFLPQFNEGTAMIAVFAPPGISLKTSNEIGLAAERKIMEVPEIKSVSRRTGRAEQDEHAMGVNVSEIDVDFKSDSKRSREEILDDIRTRVGTIPGVGINVGQPISHLIDHMVSGVSAQIAIKIFGEELETLRGKAADVKLAIAPVAGLVDLRVEQQGLIPQLKIHVLREEAAHLGISSGEITELLESAFNGHVISQVLEGQKFFDLFYRFDESSRTSMDKMGNTIIKVMPDGRKVRLSEVADIYETEGPNEISRENGQRRIIISANVSGRDLGSVVADIQKNINAKVQFPQGYYVVYGGQFQAQKEASARILLFGAISILGIALILYSNFHSKMITAQIMLTIPFAFIGGIILLFFTDRSFTVASLVGFITLCGIASRNGIMMISHYLHLIKYEGESFSKEMVIRGSLERLIPVLMTATVASLALLPLVFAKGEPGSEILHPVAIVIVGGLISSTLLDIIVTPTVFYNFGKKAALKSIEDKNKELI